VLDEPPIGCGEDPLAQLREAPERGGSGSVTRPQGHGHVLGTAWHGSILAFAGGSPNKVGNRPVQSLASAAAMGQALVAGSPAVVGPDDAPLVAGSEVGAERLPASMAAVDAAAPRASAPKPHMIPDRS